MDLTTGILSGSIYSANCGWISLSNSMAWVQTTSIARGADQDSDLLPDAWERSFTNNLSLTAGSDDDGDGIPNQDEYIAGTNPLDAADHLRIVSLQRDYPLPQTVVLFWNAKPDRFYAVQTRTSLSGGDWEDWVVPYIGMSGVNLPDSGESAFYRIRAFRPLTP